MATEEKWNLAASLIGIASISLSAATIGMDVYAHPGLYDLSSVFKSEAKNDLAIQSVSKNQVLEATTGKTNTAKPKIF